MIALPDRGRLGVLPLPALLLLVHRVAFSGRLRLSAHGTTRTVDLHAGKPLRVGGGNLCARLVADGVLSREDAMRATARAQAHGATEEKALLALHLLTPRELWLRLREHESELLLDCFAWPDGEFDLTPGEPASAAAAALAHDPVHLVHRGVSTHWSAERAIAALGAAGDRFATPGPGFEQARLALGALPGFDVLCERLDGRTRLADAARLSGHAGAPAAALVLDALDALTYAEEPATSDCAEPAPSPPVPEIEILIARQGGASGHETDASVRAAAGELASGRVAAAAARRSLLERHTRLSDLDHYALLGVPRSADAAAIRQAYVTAAKTFHPDAIARLGLEDLREAANTLFARIGNAHGVLSDPARRRAYDEEFEGGGAEEAQRIASAETLYRKGEVLLRKGSFDEALRFLRPAAELAADDAAYRSALGWALYKKQPPEPDAARAELERAIALDPRLAAAHLRLGSVLRALGKEEQAALHLARAHELDSRSPNPR